MADMTPDKALNKVRKLINLFSEFQDAEEMLDTALKERKATNSVRKEREAISAEIADLTPRLTDLKAALKTVGDDLVMKAEGAEKVYRATVRDIASKLKKKVAEAGETSISLEKQHAWLVASQKGEIFTLKKDKSQAEQQLATLRRDLRKMQERLSKVA